MQRELFEQRLNELLDLRAVPEDDSQLGDEALLDDEQREVMRAQRWMLDGLTASEVPPISDGFAERVVAQVRSETAVQTKRTASLRRVSRIILSITCAVLLLVAAVPLWSWLNSPTDGVDVAAPNPPPAAPEAVLADDVEVEADPPAVADEPIQVAADTPPSEEQIARRYREMYRIISRLSAQPDGAAEQDLLAMRPQWVDEMALGLKPVATSVGGAINVLRRNLPPSEKADPEEKPQARNYSDADSQIV